MEPLSITFERRGRDAMDRAATQKAAGRAILEDYYATVASVYFECAATARQHERAAVTA